MANLSKIRRDELLAFIEKLKEQNKDDESIRSLNEIANALTEKKYGLVWEKHTEKVDEMLEHNIPVFEEVEERKIKADESNNYNFLLEGDNLHSLKLLEKTHKGKIDVIYIDPPYNTKNKDFIYNDSYVDKNDGYAHSKWLSFMSERLEIAKELLSDEGVIFISIDDNEQAQLKLLCDEVFGEENFVTNIHCQLSTTQGMKVKAAQQGNIVKNAEYIIVYAKNGRKNIARNPLYDARLEYDEHYSLFLKDNGDIVPLKDIYDYRYPKDMANKKSLSLAEAFRKSQDFYEFIEKNRYKIGADDKISGFDNINGLYYLKWLKTERKNKVYYLTRNSKNRVRQILVLGNSWGETDGYKSPNGLRKIRGDWWEGFYLDMGNVTKEGSTEFKNGKKPIRLIKQIVKMIGSTNATILDFFAGSGTTGHAVIQLNKEDGGNRKYILCTNNENNICEEVTYQRLKNIQEELPHNLKYLKTDFIPKFDDEDDEASLSDRLIDYIKPLIELEYMCEIDAKNKLIILDEDDVESAINKANEGATIFRASDVFISGIQMKGLEDKGIKVVDIPDYYFKNELMEVGEL